MTPATECRESVRTRLEGQVPQESELAIHVRIDTLAEAIRKKNLDQVMSHYAPDVIVYDVLPPLEVRGPVEYRKNFEKWFASMSGRISYEMMEVNVSAGATRAFSHCLGHVTGARTGGGRADYWVRVTSGWKKVQGAWLVSHEHISMPSMM